MHAAAHGQDRVRLADRIIVDENRAARLSDGDIGPDPDTADRDGFCAAGPQRVDHQLQVAVEDDLPAAGTRCLETSDKLGLTPGSVTVTVRPGPMTGVLADVDSSLSRPPSSRCPCASATSARRCTSSTWAASALRRAVSSPVDASAARTPAASTCWAALTPGQPCGPERRRRRTPLPPTTPPPLARLARARGRRSAACWRGRVRRPLRRSRIEVFGEQRAQQRRHGDELRSPGLVSAAARLGS
ncbi:hypothetical protein I553_6481 [Mycobacterium xenopi 4042]|uniref:Uncharacterized protein n=1 Tax=Mycobacterium xenopi 4042 TaxID=1299334 RepID=X8BGK9_MYCXE|nr:hypothetical protein I553_6481 [Mycobacterium xenopi 4042]